LTNSSIACILIVWLKKMHCVNPYLCRSDTESPWPALKKKWGDSFTSWLEYAMECYSRDTCRGCPYESDEEQEKAVDGIGKVTDKGSE
jgi:hypothetical protein